MEITVSRSSIQERKEAAALSGLALATQKLIDAAINGTSSASIKAVYEEAHASLRGLAVPIDSAAVDQWMAARKVVYAAVARAEARETGRPIPSDRDIAAGIAKAIATRIEANQHWKRPGSEVVVGKMKQGNAGLHVAKGLHNARRADAEGRLLQQIPGHGGDAWSVMHSDGTIAAYWDTELRPKVVLKPKTDYWVG